MIAAAQTSATQQTGGDTSAKDETETAGMDGVALVEGLRMKEREEREEERREREEDEALVA